MTEAKQESLGKGIVILHLNFSVKFIENLANGYKISLGDIKGVIKVVKEL